MRILGIGEYGDLAAMYSRLAQEGHEVRVWVEDEAYRRIHRGLLQFTDDWQAELGWVRAAGEDGCIVFESATKGEWQDALRRDGFHVIGGSAYGDRLEGDRLFGQQVMQDMGLEVARCERFYDIEAAIRFIENHPARYVYKSNGADSERTRNFVGTLADGSDVIALLDFYRQHSPTTDTSPVDFMLMEHVQGIEMGIGAYFNGTRFLSPVCLDWEHKHFFPGDLGELTGEMGTVVTYTGGQSLFQRTLAHLEDALAAGGYCGYINLNMIVNEAHIWPLEFTSRFGYPGFAICSALHRQSWANMFKTMLDRDSTTFATAPGFASGVVLTVPPFPYAYGYDHLAKGMPVLFHPDISDAERQRVFLAEVEQVGDYLVTSGVIGYIGVATGTGSTVQEASANAYALAGKVIVPNVRYRNDIGQRLVNGQLDLLRQWGYIDA
ncbi:phosphoribosylamine--glycine ligase [Methylovorus menthalis]|uniref:phosphoribosylamine--glycine ligase n=1 Tax=Methylovorus menthalis TaxID=1002227 RepID=UPI001E643D3F|nr:phosphoribosylamine--glycine ligase [Methylovorus menthalis]MCB4809808.1 phosphoribosylamine--glycine ligase [Methylovorus menthalis]